MKKLNIGIIAHVDSGKTTLSEALLYQAGAIRTLGRVDKGTSFLDDNAVERQRGITVFSKMVRFSYADTEFILIDTPGHADFAAETERTLQVLDLAILLISAPDGIKGQTMFLWNMLTEYNIPVFIFINKMDQEGAGKEDVLKSIHQKLSGYAADVSEGINDTFLEQAASFTDEALEEYFSSGTISDETLQRMIRNRQLFPCIFGSALKMEGISELLDTIDAFASEAAYPDEFSARVYKIARDKDGNRLTFIKVTGGTLRTKTALSDGEESSKINEIRLYSGAGFTLTDIANAGDICALTGLKHSYAGESFGVHSPSVDSFSTSVLSYRAVPPEGTDPAKILPLFRALEEESPELQVRWDDEKGAIYISVMGQVQLEVLTSIFRERFQMDISFDTESVIYRETILSTVTGVGHFEPLRHYSEVHLLLEPAERGSGISIKSSLGNDDLAANWQGQVLNTLSAILLKGILTGSEVTDINITLTAGRANVKHTEGGDFREAAIRAFRQGLMMAENVLLEPYYRFILEIPSDQTGRALNDLSLMKAEFSAPESDGSGSKSIIKGRAAVRTVKDYPLTVASYSKGEGSISLMPDGYDICSDQEKIISGSGYDPDRDLLYPSGSIFCSAGAGHFVPWNEVYSHAHLPVAGLNDEDPADAEGNIRKSSDIALGTSDIERIIAGYSMANSKDKKKGGRWKYSPKVPFPAVSSGPAPGRARAPFSVENADILLVDGYNVIFAWEDLNNLARANIDAARDALIDILNKYASIVSSEVIAVFDAYRVEGHIREQNSMGRVRVIFTAENEIADQYIEKFTNECGRSKRIAVVTSDGIEQIITRGQGCRVVSSREFRNLLENAIIRFNETHNIH